LNRPNIVLLIVDSLRPDHLGIYGYAKNHGASLDTFASQGAVFTQAVAQAPWTLPSVASILTSLYPSEHGAVLPPDGDMNDLRSRLRSGSLRLRDGQRLNPRVTTLPALLSSAGYRTLGVTANPFGAPVFGLASGFAEYEQTQALFLSETYESLVFPWLERPGECPFFLCLHAMDVHWTYPAGGLDAALIARADRFGRESARGRRARLAESDLRRIRDAYDASIHRFINMEVARLRYKISSLSLGGNTIFIFTADHGEGFLDHNLLQHGNSLYDELLRIPLIFSGPRVPAGVRVDAQVRAIDIAPTILDLAGAAKPEAMRGESLLPWMAGTRNDHLPAVSELSYFHQFSLAARLPPWKYIADAGLLFNIAEDPDESRDMARIAPENLAAARNFLDEWEKTLPGRRRSLEDGSGQDVTALLRAAGYLP